MLPLSSFSLSHRIFPRYPGSRYGLRKWMVSLKQSSTCILFPFLLMSLLITKSSRLCSFFQEKLTTAKNSEFFAFLVLIDGIYEYLVITMKKAELTWSYPSTYIHKAHVSCIYVGYVCLCRHFFSILPLKIIIFLALDFLLLYFPRCPQLDYSAVGIPIILTKDFHDSTYRYFPKF